MVLHTPKNKKWAAFWRWPTSYQSSCLRNKDFKFWCTTPEGVSKENSLRKYVNTADKYIYFYFSKLPNPFLDGDCDICLIVKDLEKGWKVDHEPTTQNYQELLDSKNVSFITEVFLYYK